MVEGFFKTIADAGRDLLDRRPSKLPAPQRQAQTIIDLSRDLLSQRGEALGTALAREVVLAYEALDASGRQAFFEVLRDDFGPDLEALDSAVEGYRQDRNQESAIAVARAIEPARQVLFRAINMAPGGTAAVIGMRQDLLDLLPEHPDLAVIDDDLVHLLSSWFNRGFLHLERIDWQTPAHILEKLIQYEEVHEFQGWEDLRRRLDSDRRCFAFFHPALPDEPLIFVQVALVNGLSASIQELLDGGKRDDPEAADTAVFYSISNCQPGLRGISFGNFLIKQVVVELQAELPSLTTFATLSPIPGVMRWLAAQRNDPDSDLDPALRERLAALDTSGWHQDPAVAQALREPLMRLCAHYLVVCKRDGDRPLDRVARFHLGNGARIERLNWLGDTSDKGLAQSAGLLVNYAYDMKKIAAQHEAYVNRGAIAASRAVRALATANGGRRPR
jgi:malonyl-CoA decarboxylase